MCYPVQEMVLGKGSVRKKHHVIFFNFTAQENFMENVLKILTPRPHLPASDSEVR
jgi:hypothetical protein